MRLQLLSFLLICEMTSLAAEAPPFRPLPTPSYAEGQLRVMTYNILGGRNPDGKRDLNRVALIINTLNPDVVALQEVDVGTKRLQGRNLPEELAKLTNRKAWFAAAMDYDGGQYGEAILTKISVTKHVAHPLPHQPASEPRVALELHCLHPARKQPFLFIGTHLDHQNAETDRAMQARQLREIFTEKSLTAPAILCGDLNAPLTSKGLTCLTEFWHPSWPPDRPGATFPATQPAQQIDHLLVHPKQGWKVLRTQTGLEVFPSTPAWRAALAAASDHLPVVLEVELPAD